MRGNAITEKDLTRQLAELRLEVEGLCARLAERDRQLVERDRQLVERDRQLVERDKRIAALEAEVADLREQLGKNSSNSGMPPSSDPPEARYSRAKKGPSGRKPGGQPGHQGHYRELVPPENVTKAVEHRPLVCSCCGEHLPQTATEPVERHQVVEIPPITPEVTEHRAYEEVCPNCGTAVRAPFPTDVPASSVGPRLAGLFVLLTGAYRLSKRNAQSLLEIILNIRFSLGALSNTEHRVSTALAQPVEEAKQHVQAQPVKNCDATSWRTGNLKRQMWVIASTLVSVFCITVNGTAETVRDLLKSFASILISDRGSVFAFWVKSLRQVCWAHLIRAFHAMEQRAGASAEVGADLLAQSHIVMHLWHRVRDGTLKRSSFQTYIQAPKARMKQALERGTTCGHAKTQRTCDRILKLFEAMWTFARVEGVEPTNNRAEQDLRHAVLWRRISYGTQSDRGDRFVERIMTTVRTLRLQRRNILEYLTSAYVAHLTHSTPPSLLPAEPIST